MPNAVVGIDPGGDWCGWAVFELNRDGVAYRDSGVWDLRTHRHEGGGMYLVRLAGGLNRVLDELLDEGLRPCVCFEHVRFHGEGNPIDAAHVYGEVTGMIKGACEALGVPYTAIYPSTARKLFVGKGNATKEETRECVEGWYGDNFSHGDRKMRAGKRKGELVKLYDESDAACMALAFIRQERWDERA